MRNPGNAFLAILALLAALFWTFTFGVSLGSSMSDTKDQRYQPYRYAAEQPSEINSSAAGPSSSKAFQERTPCEQPIGRDESDLCAQWKAANAAEDSALWTKWGFWIGVIGSALLLWQIILTRKAVEDTGEATATMREANQIARLDQRPWLKVEMLESTAWAHDGGYRLSLRGKARNVGHHTAVLVGYAIRPRRPVISFEGVNLVSAGVGNDDGFFDFAPTEGWHMAVLPGDEWIFMRDVEIGNEFLFSHKHGAIDAEFSELDTNFSYEWPGGQGQTGNSWKFWPTKIGTKKSFARVSATLPLSVKAEIIADTENWVS